MKRLEKDFPRLAQTLRDFQSALLETGLASDGAIQDVLCACRQGLAAGAAFAVCVPPADDVPALTAASFSDGEPDAEKILLPLKEICRGHPASGIYDADGLCERAPGDAPSLLHRGIFRGKETVGCVGVIGEPGRAWTPGEKHAVRLLGNALRGHVIENHDRLLSERECGEGRGSRDRLEQEKRNVAVDELIVNVFDSCYLIDLDEDAFVVVRRSASLERYIPRKGRYSATIAEWADHLVASEDREQVKQMLSPAFMRSRLREVARYSVPYVSTRGGWRRHFEAQVVRGDGGDGVHNVIVAFLDQEDVVRQDMEQKQRQAMLQELVHAGAWSIENVRGSHTLTARFSDVMRHLMGFEGAGDLPDTFEAFLERVHPDHRDRTFSRVWQALREADAEKIYEWEYRVLTKDRGYRWFRASGRVSKVSRDSVRLFGVFIDIDARKEHDRLVQEKLAAYEQEHLLKEELEHEKKVVDLLHGMLNSGRWGVRFRPDGTIGKLEMSGEFRRMLGYAPEENFPASPAEWEAGIAPDQRAQMIAEFSESVRSAAHCYEAEYRMMTKERGYRWFRAVARGITGTDGVLKEYVGVFFDITEEKRIKHLHHAESVINILSDEFDSVAYVERKDLKAVAFRRNAWIERYIPGWNDTPSFPERFRLVGEHLVTAEDLADYRRSIDPERVFAVLDEKGVYEVNFRIRRDGELLYYQAKMVIDASSRAGNFVIGLRSTDAQVRRENEQNRLLTEACRKAD
ncbi:MAG: PAS domain-containing protein [Desulfovibrio sp.]|nr:PAS domain-containing protein [Desulfovibrio sp.]